MKPITGYPGTKSAAGLCERIIRQMPPHETYIEPFAGHAAVFWRKRPAVQSILCDLDLTTCQTLTVHVHRRYAGFAQVWHLDALEALKTLEEVSEPETLVYCDPPYLLSTRRRKQYACEFETPAHHLPLLKILKAVPCMVMISGYASKLYHDELKGWRCVQIPAMSRGGPRIERLWCNFPEPARLHDPAFAGGNYRERENIKKKRQRWTARFAAMPERERQVIAEALAAADPVTLQMAMRSVPPEAAGKDLEAISYERLAISPLRAHVVGGNGKAGGGALPSAPAVGSAASPGRHRRTRG